MRIQSVVNRIRDWIYRAVSSLGLGVNSDLVLDGNSGNKGSIVYDLKIKKLRFDFNFVRVSLSLLTVTIVSIPLVIICIMFHPTRIKRTIGRLAPLPTISAALHIAIINIFVLSVSVRQSGSVNVSQPENPIHLDGSSLTRPTPLITRVVSIRATHPFQPLMALESIFGVDSYRDTLNQPWSNLSVYA